MEFRRVLFRSADKHHMLIPTQAAMVIHRLAFLSPSGVPTGGSIERVTLISPYGEQAAAIGLSSGIGAKLAGDPRAAFDIRFAKGGPVEGEQIGGESCRERVWQYKET